MSVLQQAMNAAGAVGAKAVDRVTIRSQVTPELTYDPTAPGGQAREPSWVMELVRPEIVLHTPAGPMAFAPYGPPKRNYFPLAVAAGVVGTGALGYLVLRGLGVVGRS